MRMEGGPCEGGGRTTEGGGRTRGWREDPVRTWGEGGHPQPRRVASGETIRAHNSSLAATSRTENTEYLYKIQNIFRI